MWEYKTETFDSIFDTKRSLKEKCNAIPENVAKRVGNLLTFNVLVLWVQ